MVHRFTDILMVHIDGRLSAEHGSALGTMARDERMMARIGTEANRAKEQLSMQPVVDIHFTDSPTFLKSPLRVHQGEFEGLIAQDVDRSFDAVRLAIERSGRGAFEDIDEVVPLGASCRIPLVRRRLIEVFGDDKIRLNLGPHVVAYGAAIVAAWRR